MAAGNAPDMRSFPDRDLLASTLAKKVADGLNAAIAQRGRATLAVSGGTTPARFFECLSAIELDWKNVIVTLADERFVPPSSDRSNEKLVRENLLVHKAAAASFVPLYSQGELDDVAAKAGEAIASLLPLDILVLGMGTDGHTASLFPDADDADMLLTQTPGPAVLPVHAPSAGEPRLTLSLDALSKARATYLHIEGAEKRAVLERATEGKLPVAAVLDAANTPVVTYWAP
ncbi:6-phosphogluconolactonase [Aliihoeflea sp. PC F10.4]